MIKKKKLREKTQIINIITERNNTTDLTGIREIRKYCKQLYPNKFNNLNKIIFPKIYNLHNDTNVITNLNSPT